MRVPRRILWLPFGAALLVAQFRESGSPELAARLELETQPLLPARVYLFKDDRPFRLSPVDATLPLRVDLFYRERLWKRAQTPSVLEVTCNDISHFLLLNGRAGFDLPAGRYRIEAYRGLFYKPFREEFELKAGQTSRVALKLENWLGAGQTEWLSGDDHIHLVRAPEDDPVFLAWMEAEDLSVGNFLQLQRQMDAAAQYGFGPKAEARRSGRSIRSGHESRSEFFGHVNLLGAREMVRPLSVGAMYANSPETFPYPFVLFEMGRKLGATTGYAHFDGSMRHSTLLMDLALGSIDFVEVFQFGVLKTEQWYELLNAGLKVTGIAGSDFPVSLNRHTQAKDWGRWIPLLGPERYLRKATAGASAYETWAEGVRRGEGLVTNGPVAELRVEGEMAIARARFYRPLERLEIVANGAVIAAAPGGREALEVSARAPHSGPVWMAARAIAPKQAGEPVIQAHTNPVYMRWDGTAPVPAARQAVARRWETQVEYYKTAPLVFPEEGERARFFARAAEAAARLRAN